MDELIIIGRKRIGKITKIDKDTLVEAKFDTSGKQIDFILNN